MIGNQQTLTNHNRNQEPRTKNQLGPPSSRFSVLGSSVRRSWLKWLLIGIVVAYVVVLIVVPLAALINGAFAGGLGAIYAALSEPDVLSAFGRTLGIAAIVVLIHAICGT